jgi:hypothetical protein
MKLQIIGQKLVLTITRWAIPHAPGKLYTRQTWLKKVSSGFLPAGLSSFVSLDYLTHNFIKGEVGMQIDKERIHTQEETGEKAPMDQVEERVEAEMKKIEGQAKQQVADGLQDKELAREGERLQREGEQELEEAKDQ